MNLLKTIQRPVIYITAAALLGACASTEGPGGSKQQGAANEDPCSVGSSALAGALAGALLGALVDGKNGALRGGAIGAGVGALAACPSMSTLGRPRLLRRQSRTTCGLARPCPRSRLLLLTTLSCRAAP